jgi:hypothetical protein
MGDSYIEWVTEWDREEWMQDHGEWESARWDERREARDEAREALAEVLREAASADGNIANIDFDAIEEARVAAVEAEKALDGEVTPEADYIAEGLIDPDEVSDDPGRKIWSNSWQGWDCTEGESVFVAVTDRGLRVVHRWWRNAYGQRHDRDLWRVAETCESAGDIAHIFDNVVPDRAVWDLAADLARENPDLARRVRERCDEAKRARRALDAVLPPAEADEADEADEPAEADEAAANG